MSEPATGQIDNVMQETRVFPPASEFSASANIKSLDQYQELYDRAKSDPEQFWGEIAKDELHWFEPFDHVLSQEGNVYSWLM